MATLDISQAEVAIGGGERGEDTVEGVGTSSKLNSLKEVFLGEMCGKISGQNGKTGVNMAVRVLSTGQSVKENFWQKANSQTGMKKMYYQSLDQSNKVTLDMSLKNMSTERNSDTAVQPPKSLSLPHSFKHTRCYEGILPWSDRPAASPGATWRCRLLRPLRRLQPQRSRPRVRAATARRGEGHRGRTWSRRVSGNCASRNLRR